MAKHWNLHVYFSVRQDAKSVKPELGLRLHHSLIFDLHCTSDIINVWCIYPWLYIISLKIHMYTIFAVQVPVNLNNSSTDFIVKIATISLKMCMTVTLQRFFSSRWFSAESIQYFLAREHWWSCVNSFIKLWSVASFSCHQRTSTTAEVQSLFINLHISLTYCTNGSSWRFVIAVVAYWHITIWLYIQNNIILPK